MENYNSYSEDKKNKDFKVQEVFLLVVITCIFSFFAGTSFARMKDNPATLEENNTDNHSEALNNFIANYENIINNYYKKLDEEELLSAALEGMLNLLNDPYSIYMNEDDYSNINLSLEGSYSGLGVSIFKHPENNYMVISSVFDSSPADKAGLEVGDFIVLVNGKSTTDMTTSEFSQSVRNGNETDYKLTILRKEKKFEVDIKKSDVTIKSVAKETYKKNNKTIGYIYVSIFANNTYEQFKDALEQLEKEQIDGLIIDVRDNTGGHLTSVSKMISLFVDSKHIAYQLEQNEKKEKIYSQGKENKDYPIIILANENSASASEVLIGSLRDNLGAKLVGTKTFGKGTVQELVTLSNGDKYKITTKKWLTPNGNWVNDTEGIVPDIEVELSKEYFKNPSDATDNQLQKALEEITK